jgi:curved DNA-binding protein CbpA
MPKFRTHYDNLKVSPDAPIEVIQAAYRSLARKYHPDTNGADPKSEAIMKVINASYEVLSDPVKRAKHDEWIASQSMQRGRQSPWGGPSRTDSDTRPSDRRRKSAPSAWSFVDVLLIVAYFGSSLFLLRFPNTRMIAIGMLVAGWLFLRSRSR